MILDKKFKKITKFRFLELWFFELKGADNKLTSFSAKRPIDYILYIIQAVVGLKIRQKPSVDLDYI